MKIPNLDIQAAKYRYQAHRERFPGAVVLIRLHYGDRYYITFGAGARFLHRHIGGLIPLSNGGAAFPVCRLGEVLRTLYYYGRKITIETTILEPLSR
jgi:hypothetical protein